MDPAYYLEREQAERRMAEQSANEKARTIHLELADRYRALAETYDRAGVPQARTA